MSRQTHASILTKLNIWRKMVGMIAIVGASTSGLFCAHLLAKKGFKVTLFERQKVVGPPKKTLIVTPKINEVLGFVPKEATINRVKKFELFSQNQTVQITLKEPEFVLEREKLVKILAQKAKRAGVKIKTGLEFLGAKRSPSKLILKLKNLKNQKLKRVEAEILIGADGAQSQVAKTTGLFNQNLVALVQAEVGFTKKVDQEKVKIWFDPQRTKYFFWLIPESEKGGMMGLIDEDLTEAKSHLEDFLGSLKLTAQNFQTGLVPLYHPALKVSQENIFLVGDAASQVKITTIGGTVTGLRGAQTLAFAIIYNKSYPKVLKKLKYELGLHYLIRKALNKFDGHDYDRLLGLLDKKTKDILAQYTRNEVVKGALKLLLAQPKLLSFATKLLSG